MEICVTPGQERDAGPVVGGCLEFIFEMIHQVMNFCLFFLS